MDILGFPLIRRHTSKKHVNQLIYNNAWYTSQAEAAAPRHTVPDTSDALLAPRRPHAHAHARAHASTSSQQTRPAHPSFIVSYRTALLDYKWMPIGHRNSDFFQLTITVWFRLGSSTTFELKLYNVVALILIIYYLKSDNNYCQE